MQLTILRELFTAYLHVKPVIWLKFNSFSTSAYPATQLCIHVTETESEVDKFSFDEIASCSSEVHCCLDWSGSLAKGKQDFNDNNEYNESIELAMQEEDIAKGDKLESTLSLTKLPVKVQKGSSKRISKTCHWLTKEGLKIGPVTFESMLLG